MISPFKRLSEEGCAVYIMYMHPAACICIPSRDARSLEVPLGTINVVAGN